MAEIVLTDNNFQETIKNSQQLVMVDFWASWCAPCRMLAPVVEEIAKDYEGKLAVGKLNVDENPNTASSFGVMSIPTLIFFKNGQEVERIIGFQPKEALQKVIDSLL